MNDDREDPNPAVSTSGGATIQLWRSPNRIWPGFAGLSLARSVRRRSPAIGEGGVVTIFLDGSKVGLLSPGQIAQYPTSPGEHSLGLRFLGGLRRSKNLNFSLAEGETKQFVCSLNQWAWPTIRSATRDDVTAMEQSRTRGVDDSLSSGDDSK